MLVELMTYKAAHMHLDTEEMMVLHPRSASSLCCIASKCIDLHSKRLHTHASHAEQGASRTASSAGRGACQGAERTWDRPLRMHTHAQAAAYTCIALATRFNRLRTNAFVRMSLALARHTVSQAALLASKGGWIRAHYPSTSQPL